MRSTGEFSLIESLTLRGDCARSSLGQIVALGCFSLLFPVAILSADGMFLLVLGSVSKSG